MKDKGSHDKSLTKLIMAGVGLSGTILNGASASDINSKNIFSSANKTENSGVQTNFITINDIKNNIQEKKAEKAEKTQEENIDFFSNISDFVEFKEKITEELGYFVSENFNSEISQEEMTLDKLLGRAPETEKKLSEEKEDSPLADEENDFYEQDYSDGSVSERSIPKGKQVYELDRFYGFKEMNPDTRW